jgi:MFS family permease
MYPSLRSPAAVQGQVLSLVGGPLRWLRVGRNVFYLGLNSMLTDIGTEMVNAVLPLFLTLQLGLGPLAFGVFTGGYQAVTALGRLGSGVVGDRRRRHKEVATVGYAVSAMCKLALVAVSGQSWLASGVLYLDRVGKGARTTPRDALISLSSPRGRLGEAFGVHRAMDTAGAVLGPLAAFGVLMLLPRDFTAIFAVSFCFGLAGLAVLVLKVRNPGGEAGEESRDTIVSLRGGLRLLARPRVATLAVVAAALGAATISDSFVYLAIQNRTHMDIGWFPLLYVGTSASYLLLAIPAGRLADRLGRSRVLLGGYGALFGVYALLLVPTPGTATVLLALALFGGYYAATDGVLMALASTALPAAVRGSGLATIATASSVAQFASALVFGALWAWQGPWVAVRIFGFALLVAVAAAALILSREWTPRSRPA